MNPDALVPTVDWESLGFERQIVGEPPYDRLAFVCAAGTLQFNLVYGEVGVLAEVGFIGPTTDTDPSPRYVREHHIVSEDEALGWFGIWLPGLWDLASTETRSRFQRHAKAFRQRWPLDPDASFAL